jgi:beta-lactamase regulating signal transducer with metallopeptidase domain
MNCTFLDYVWGGLIAASLSSALFMLVHWALAKTLAPRLSARTMKWYFHAHYSLLAAVVTAGFLLTFLLNRDLATGCFEKFAAQSQGFPLTRVLAGLWLAGIVSAAAYDLWRTLRTRRWVRSQPVALVHGGIPVRVTDENPSPLVFGFLSHEIVVPKSLLSEKRALEHVLAHEMAHIRERDSAWMLAEKFCRTVLFFNPLAAILGRSYNLTVEKAADRLAIEHGRFPPGEYARTLIAIAENVANAKGSQAKTCAAGLNMSRCYRDLRERIEELGVNRRHPVMGLIFLFAGSLALSAGLAWAQSYIELQRPKGGQCRQVEHEKTIESWLNIETEPRTCEETAK